MKTDGVLLRLSKIDFVDLLKLPLLNQVDMTEAVKLVATGAVWVDVRLPSEFKFCHLPNAINLPLHQLRSLLNELDVSRQYVVCCNTGRRSNAAAFILMKEGFDVLVLQVGKGT